MSDYLVKLWELPSPEPYYASLREKNIVIRKPIGPPFSAIRRAFTLPCAKETPAPRCSDSHATTRP